MRIFNNVIILIKLILQNQWLERLEKTKIVFRITYKGRGRNIRWLIVEWQDHENSQRLINKVTSGRLATAVVDCGIFD
jgi:hypothetical protein